MFVPLGSLTWPRWRHWSATHISTQVPSQSSSSWSLARAWRQRRRKAQQTSYEKSCHCDWQSSPRRWTSSPRSSSIHPQFLRFRCVIGARPLYHSLSVQIDFVMTFSVCRSFSVAVSSNCFSLTLQNWTKRRWETSVAPLRRWRRITRTWCGRWPR